MACCQAAVALDARGAVSAGTKEVNGMESAAESMGQAGKMSRPAQPARGTLEDATKIADEPTQSQNGSEQDVGRARSVSARSDSDSAGELIGPAGKVQKLAQPPSGTFQNAINSGVAQTSSQDCSQHDLGSGRSDFGRSPGSV